MHSIHSIYRCSSTEKEHSLCNSKRFNMLNIPLLLLMTGSSFINVGVGAHHTNPTVVTPLGAIEGSILTSVLGKQIYSFRGIRYAKPPVGELRFQPPIPVERWNDVYNATQDGSECPQPSDDPVSEDCLFLNVYTTKLPQHGKNPKRPVIVYFHAGGFYSVSGTSQWAGPQYLLDQDVVLVTLNYRLASLGFLSTGDRLAPGNNGLKDQVIALRWIKNNIAAFGGNPDLVTITGYSAGGGSVTLHLVSPMSRGLFHRAIAMSGSSFANWPVPTHQFDLAQKQARLVGCPDDTSTSVINCLKTKSAKELGDSLAGFNEFRTEPILKWKPVVEPDFGQERFLTDNPTKLIQRGEFANVPVMTGVTTEEFSYRAFSIVANSTLLKEMDEHFETVAPIAFLYERDTDNSKFISKQLRKHYLGNGSLTSASRSGIGKLYADGVIGFGVNRAAKLLAEKSSEPVYYYRFAYRGRYSHYNLPGTETPFGAVHHDDLIYLFYIEPLFPKFNESYPEYATTKKLTKLFRNFAYTGKPIPEPTAELDNVDWSPFTVNNKKYMDIDTKLVMKRNLYHDRYTEWEKLFPLSMNKK